MIFDPKEQSFKENHRLMIGSILPRPIALVSTKSKDGVNNLAPFSFFNGVCANPPTIMFAPARRAYDGKTKDTLNNIRETGEFVVNIVSETFAEKMVACSTDFDSSIDEFQISGLSPVSSLKIKSPRVKEALVNFECKLNQIIQVGGELPGSGFVILGTIVMFHVHESVYDQGHINLEILQPLGRLGGNDYSRIKDTITINRKIKPD
ncbi:MAG: flavin reductase family protein [Candidatus Neomarinimicrobiota bacterium]